VGRGPEKRKLVNLVNNLNLEDKVEFIDWTDNVYSASCELPIIMTNVGCAGEVIKNGESGLVTPVNNREKLEQAMIKLIADKGLREKLGRMALKSIPNLLNQGETLKLYKKSWEKALKL